MKNYVKPELFFEQFELSQHIADCDLEFVSGATSADSCIAYTDEKVFGTSYPVFTSANAECTERWNEYCYSGGPDGSKIFAS